MTENKKETSTLMDTQTPIETPPIVTANPTSDTPVLPDGKPAPEDTEIFQKDVSETQTSPTKKRSVLWAKILVVLLLFFMGFLGLYKLADYLNRPKTLFYSVVETTYGDFKEIMDKFKSNDLFKVLTNEGVEIHADVDFDSSNLKDEFTGLESIINSLDYTADISLNKKEKYVGMTLSIKKDGTERLTSSYVDTDYKNYLSIPTILEGWTELDFGSINLDALSPDGNLYVAEIIKSELLNLLDDEEFTSKEEAIAVNGRTVDCKKSSYVLQGSEISAFIDRVIEKIKQNSITYYYVADLLGVQASEIDTKLLELKSGMGIQATSIFTFSAYTKKDTDEAVRLEMERQNSTAGQMGDIKLSYTKDSSYMRLEYTKDDIVNSIELKGDLNGTYELDIRDSQYETTFVKENRDRATNCAIKVVTAANKENLYDGTFTYTLTPQASSAYSLAIVFELDSYSNGEAIKHELNVDAIVNTNIKINKIAVPNDSRKGKLDEAQRQKLKGDLAEFLRNLATPPEPVLPSTPEMPTE